MLSLSEWCSATRGILSSDSQGMVEATERCSAIPYTSTTGLPPQMAFQKLLQAELTVMELTCKTRSLLKPMTTELYFAGGHVFSAQRNLSCTASRREATRCKSQGNIWLLPPGLQALLQPLIRRMLCHWPWGDGV